jgi:hypothetical protein
MSDFGPALTDDQWNRIRQIVHDETLRARGRVVPASLRTDAGRRDVQHARNRLSLSSSGLANLAVVWGPVARLDRGPVRAPDPRRTKPARRRGPRRRGARAHAVERIGHKRRQPSRREPRLPGVAPGSSAIIIDRPVMPNGQHALACKKCTTGAGVRFGGRSSFSLATP